MSAAEMPPAIATSGATVIAAVDAPAAAAVLRKYVLYQHAAVNAQILKKVSVQQLADALIHKHCRSCCDRRYSEHRSSFEHASKQASCQAE
jgi:hypothetical protein